jgi:hypothetical protein
MSETFGIVPNVAENSQSKESDIIDLLDARANSNYICKKMRFTAPILPVLTIQEKQLFSWSFP